MNKQYATILVLVLACIVIFIFSGRFVFLYTALAMGTVATLIPWVSKTIHFLWMKLSVLLGSVSATILLTLIFFVIVVPLSFIAKLTGKKFITLKRKENSYFKPRNLLYNKESMENVW